MLSQKNRQIAGAFIARLVSVPEREMASFLDMLHERSYDSGAFFTKAGERHDRVGLVIEGLFRVYYGSLDGEIHIRNFCKEGMLIGSYATILTKQPAHVFIEALENSLVLEFPFSALADRYDKHPGWERLGRKIAEQYYIARERREYDFLTQDAAARLEQFRLDFPGLERRISKSSIASYIGVRPETLSRLSKIVIAKCTI